MGTIVHMSRTPKQYEGMDAAVAGILDSAVESSGQSLRSVAEKAGMSHNRLGKILRRDTPPPTVGEVDRIAVALGMTASEVFTLAESEVSDVARDDLATRRAAKDAEADRRLAEGHILAASEGDSFAELEDQPDADPDNWGA